MRNLARSAVKAPLAGAPPLAAALYGFALLSLVAGCASPPPAGDDVLPPHGVIGVSDAHLDPQYWIGREIDARRVVLDDQAIAAQNSRLVELDPSVHDVEQLPAELDGGQVRQWLSDLSARPTIALYDENGGELQAAELDALVASTAADAIAQQPATRFGLAVRRADLRTFPTRQRIFYTSESADIDRFQESALFPGTPVAIVHESRDGEWWFVVSPMYMAWVEKRHIAEGDARAVFEYTRKSPYVVVTGATVATVYTREMPAVSALQLDMGVRVPVVADWPADRQVNGQHPYAAHVIELPVRAADGTLRFSPALLPRTADVAREYLPLNRANLLRQSFKFLGERYGWGHSYNARDCSGFVSEVYRSFGVRLPRNTRDQGVSPALNRVALRDVESHEARQALLRDLEVGDLVYIPGHVMMVIGHDNGTPYVIHDTTGISYRRADGATTRVRLNGVSVTPLAPLLIDGAPMVESITNILRIRS